LIGIIKTSAFLFVTAVIVVAMLVFSHSLTLQPIEYKYAQARAAVIRDVFPHADDYTDYQPAEGFPGNIAGVTECTANGVFMGYVVELFVEGYSGTIDLMVGISSTEGAMTGMRVISHTETPGLGALIVKDTFFRRYDNRALKPLTVVRAGAGEYEIDALASATISTRAVTNAVNEAIEWYNGINR